MPRIPTSEFNDITTELMRRPLEQNMYRKRTGEGRSQAFGLVNRRCLPPDYSRNNWKRPYLYKLLLDFGAKYVDLSYNAITVNQDYQAGKHRDNNNTGDSFLVAFGSYTGGDLVIHEGDLSGNHNIYCNPIKTDFSKVYHSVLPFKGHRYSLVYYTLVSKKMPESIPPPSVREENGEYFFYRGEEKVAGGLKHPLLGRTRKEILATAKHKRDMKAGKYDVSFE